MTRYVAFLRAINVGGRTVTMERLRALFTALGLAEVETFIASGNVVFSAPAGDAEALERRIERHLQEQLGFPVATFLRTTAEVAAAARHQPFPPAEVEGQVLYVLFLPSAPTPEAQRKLLALRNEVDDFHVHGREVYWLARKQLSESTVTGAHLEKALGMPATNRNLTTVRKLAAKHPP
ncbi:MAG TPA: DUF1697 domain-containing protein [Longimicrobiaceae bacterium]|nr:DUF1697 domain-containing protein [Longimicrobiaceae bacterium]